MSLPPFFSKMKILKFSKYYFPTFPNYFYIIARNFQNNSKQFKHSSVSKSQHHIGLTRTKVKNSLFSLFYFSRILGLECQF